MCFADGHIPSLHRFSEIVLLKNSEDETADKMTYKEAFSTSFKLHLVEFQVTR